jgi:hypothetical protein
MLYSPRTIHRLVQYRTPRCFRTCSTPSSNIVPPSNKLYGLPRLGRFLDLLSTVLRLFCTACREVEVLGWDGDDGGRASETAVGVRIPGVALAVVFSSCAPSPMSGSRPASGPFGLCVILWPLPEVSSEINGSCDCFSCSSTSISRSLLSSCSSSVFWKVMDCRLQSGSVFV